MKYLFFLVLMLNTATAGACLNYYLVDERGRVNEVSYFRPDVIRIRGKEVAKRLKQLEKDLQDDKLPDRFKYLSDYGACLIEAGHSDKALKILRKLALQRPGEYEILANLGVAYELTGQPDSALICLNKSLQINPKSHNESEWIHQQILAYAISQNGTGVKRESTVLNIKTDSVGFTGRQIAEQLSERLPLTNSPNALLSKVIEESADFYRKNVSLDWAINLYAIAIGYSNDGNVIKEIWSKIEAAREKLFALSKRDKFITGDLLKSNWRKMLEAEVSKWSSFRPYRYTGAIGPVIY